MVATDIERNNYILVDSCHHEPWFINIPKGQMIRLRRNCTNHNEYLGQAQWIGNKFVAKGYSKEFIEDKIQEVYQIPRNLLIQDKEKKHTQ